MDDDVGEVKTAIEKPFLHPVRDFVAFTDRAFTGNANVNVRISHEPAFSHAALLHARYAFDSANGQQNLRDYFR